MAKKRRKKSAKSLWAMAGEFLRFSSWLFLKALPLFLFAALGGVLWVGIREALYADSYLSVQKITVKPGEELSALHLERLNERLLGKNILQLDIRRVSQELERDPQIRTARVRKVLPFELAVEIEKRVPFAFLRLPGRGLYGLVSEDGMILDFVPERGISGLTLEALGLGIVHAEVGRRVRIPGFEEAVKFSREFQNHLLARYEKVAKLGLDHLGNLTITLEHGPAIRLGRRPHEKWAALEQILPLLEGQGRAKIDYIDLQFDNVIIKHKRGVR